MNKAQVLLQFVASALGYAIASKKDFDFMVTMWTAEGRQIRICECGRKYKKLAWVLKHLFKTGHQPQKTVK